MRSRVAKGFTLLELMIVVVIIAILASLAYYNYGRYAFRTRRADGREMLMRVAAAQERYFTNFNAYASSLTAAPTSGGLGFASPADSERGYYSITTAVGDTGDNQSYILTATPQNDQASDACGALTLRNSGVKSQTGSATTNGSCW